MPVAIAAPHPAAVDAAREVVAAGGNAFDAALAAAAALTVAYPHQCSVGGDLVAMVRPARSPVRAVLSIGAAARAVDVTALGDTMPQSGPQTVTVPGVVAGWAAVHELGARLPLDRLLAFAVRLASAGVDLAPGLRAAVERRIDVIRADPGLSAIMLRPRLVQPALAQTLAAIGRDWRSFYTGPIVAGVRALGSPLTAADFAEHAAEVGDPLRTVAGDVTWHAAPPPVQGATFLAIVGSPALIADSHRAQAARNALLGDPRGGPISLDGLLLRGPQADPPLRGPEADPLLRAPEAGPPLRGPQADPLLRAPEADPPLRAPEADPPDARTAGLPEPAGDTVAVTAVDDEGNAVTLIQSVFESFGAGLLDPATGVVLHNRGSSFSLDPSHPAYLRPGLRPPHTLCPAIATTGESVVALGCQGGRAQPWILAQLAPDVLSAPDPGELAARPRWIVRGDDLILEPGLPADAFAPRASTVPTAPDAFAPRASTVPTAPDAFALRISTVPALHDDAGHVQLSRLRHGVLDAGSDPRADGLAAVLP
ncbi:gamma-glutamyltranspeptidase [Paractinoplanes abujensis]|uniref:Gamma-glutamyltranspeptidase n=1 Tax=Paractinoplanes abujensis TaxID=882441 RepID=A0A7W7G720_9ACTN|nr:gamma-glutamyltransferase [Actinoplanes abujensis]MBB4698005.1 gamma-glutamyltranspeptidase [Actinoplanes abujensis]GID19511.1 gamma-glutamyltranspeptidase [Actinoplanes abujensis]